MSHSVERIIGRTLPRQVVGGGRSGPARGRAIGAPLGTARVYRGTGYIDGVVTVDGQPASRPVRVYDRETGVLVAETTSAADGTYQVDGLAGDREYIVVAIDTARVHNAVVQDRITPAGTRRGSLSVPWAVQTGASADTEWSVQADGSLSTRWKIGAESLATAWQIVTT